MDKLNEIHNKDFLTNTLPDGCANLIIADPPYFEVKGEFDFIWESFNDYLKDVEKWGAECKRLLNENGTLLWYGDAKKIAYTQIILDKKFNLLSCPVWNKGSYLNLEHSEELRSFAPCTERLLMYSHESFNLTSCIIDIRDYLRGEIVKAKGKVNLKQINGVFGTATNGGGVASSVLSLSKSSPNMITKPHYLKLQSFCYPYLTKSYEELVLEYKKKREQYENERRPFNNIMKLKEVLEFPNEANKSRAIDHDTVKPEKLTTALILTCSRKDDLVVVPFAGSGTECAVSEREGRRFVSYEINPKHVKDARGRVEEERRNPRLFNGF